ncbi:MAG: hypothetical protein AB7F89_00640 [Pirellulaceae bacterium]
MAGITETHYGEHDPHCTLCRRPAAAFWTPPDGTRGVSVCRACAVEHLPRLIADAVFDPAADADHSWTKCGLQYFRAIARRATR